MIVNRPVMHITLLKHLSWSRVNLYICTVDTEMGSNTNKG